MSPTHKSSADNHIGQLIIIHKSAARHIMAQHNAVYTIHIAEKRGDVHNSTSQHSNIK